MGLSYYGNVDLLLLFAQQMHSLTNLVREWGLMSHLLRWWMRKWTIQLHFDTNEWQLQFKLLCVQQQTGMFGTCFQHNNQSQHKWFGSIRQNDIAIESVSPIPNQSDRLLDWLSHVVLHDYPLVPNYNTWQHRDNTVWNITKLYVCS